MNNFCQIKKLENNNWNFQFVHGEIWIIFVFTTNLCKWLSKKNHVIISVNFVTVELFVKKTYPELVHIKWHQTNSYIDESVSKPDNYYKFVLNLIDSNGFFN